MPRGPEQPEPANLEPHSLCYACGWEDVNKASPQAPLRMAGSFAGTRSPEVADSSTSLRCTPGTATGARGRWKGRGHGQEIGSWASDSSQCLIKDWSQLPNLYHEKATLAWKRTTFQSWYGLAVLHTPYFPSFLISHYHGCHIE